MASTHAAPVAPFGAIAIFRGINHVEAAFVGLKMWNANRKTNKVLSTLSFAQLEDIGLCQNGTKATNFTRIK
ncbi:hypothetical protein RB2150_03019 [Rhodobacterales bacterium HTCC2150]|nr:hypothetical protein RB2150_03019 [Rhodobacterales bacterium HTCC2150] [Rhodobacteraceae bacterium HTCC2150]